MRDAISSDGTMCPINTVERPGMIMSHTSVDWICFPSGKLICRGELVMRLLSTSAPSMMKMEVAPMLVIAWFVAIVRAFKYCGMGVPNNAWAVTAIVEGGFCRENCCNQFVVTTFVASLLQDEDKLTEVGLTENEVADNKLHLCANVRISTPHCQIFGLAGRTVLCIPFVHGSYPAVMNCWAFAWVYPAWCFTHWNRHVIDVWLSSTSNLQEKQTFQLLYLL